MDGSVGSGSRKLVAFGALAAAAFAALFASSPAFPQNAECARLQAAIASAPRGGGGQFAAAAERQRGELARAEGAANALGCNNQKFLFFGSDPPAQCGEVKGQIARMRANLADLQSRSGGGRADLIARYNAECGAAQPSGGPGNILQALFGGFVRSVAPPPMAVPDIPPPDQQQQVIEKSIEKEKRSANVSAGSYAVCVRTCDGSFFPVSYGGAGERLEDVCRSLCPNADVALYSYPFGGTIEQAVSITGEPYVNLPNALKFQQAFDSTCSCRPKGESWAQTLAAAEAKYGHDSHDIIVTPEKSAELSRPIIAKVAADSKSKPQKSNAKATAGATAATAPGDTTTAAPATAPATPDASSPSDAAARTPTLNAAGEDTGLSAAAASVSREASGIAGAATSSGAKYTQNQGQTVTDTGPDGVKRPVRIVGPTL